MLFVFLFKLNDFVRMQRRHGDCTWLQSLAENQVSTIANLQFSFHTHMHTLARAFRNANGHATADYTSALSLVRRCFSHSSTHAYAYTAVLLYSAFNFTDDYIILLVVFHRYEESQAEKKA